MSFLCPFLQERETVTNVTVASCGEEEEEINKDMLQSSVPPPMTATVSQQVSSLPRDETTSQCSISSTPNSSQRGVKRKQSTESASTTLMQYLLSRQTTDDHIETFLAGIGATMKKLSPLRQLEAKNKIYSIVSNLELQQIIEDTENN